MPRRLADVDHLAQHVRPVGFGHDGLLDAVVAWSRCGSVMCASMPTQSMHFSGPAAARSARSSRSMTLSVSKLIGDGAAGLRHGEALRHAVDADHLLGAEQDGAADRHLADRPGAPDRDRVGGLDVALHGRLPAGREDVAEEQHLLVGEAVLRHLDVASCRRTARARIRPGRPGSRR